MPHHCGGQSWFQLMAEVCSGWCAENGSFPEPEADTDYEGATLRWVTEW